MYLKWPVSVFVGLYSTQSDTFWDLESSSFLPGVYRFQTVIIEGTVNSA